MASNVVAAAQMHPRLGHQHDAEPTQSPGRAITPAYARARANAFLGALPRLCSADCNFCKPPMRASIIYPSK